MNNGAKKGAKILKNLEKRGPKVDAKNNQIQERFRPNFWISGRSPGTPCSVKQVTCLQVNPTKDGGVVQRWGAVQVRVWCRWRASRQDNLRRHALAGRKRTQSGFWDPPKTKNGSKIALFGLDQHFGPPKIVSGRGFGKNMKI